MTAKLGNHLYRSIVKRERILNIVNIVNIDYVLVADSHVYCML